MEFEPVDTRRLIGRHNFADARVLRGRETLSERLLWQQLRNRQLKGYKFRRQHPIRNFVVDFDCAEARLIVEIDGGVHRGHEQSARDQTRQEFLVSLGYRVLRIRAATVERDVETALTIIARALADAPSPGVPPAS